VQDGLKEDGVPNWAVERLFSFMSPFLPVMKSKKTGSYSIQEASNCSKPASELSDAFQDFYEELEQEILNVKGTPRRQEDVFQSQTGNEGGEREKKFNDVKVREIMESVEKVLCTVLSDRLLRPDTSDDAQHDEALASRIAALNLLDLTPEHLGVDVGSNDAALAELVLQCGNGELLFRTLLDISR
jgi:hypothetical protein